MLEEPWFSVRFRGGSPTLGRITHHKATRYQTALRRDDDRAHSIIYSTKSDVDRALLRDVFKLAHVDVGEGWLIFGLPPAEVAVHPSEVGQR